MTLPEHYEKFLGPIAGGWRPTDGGFVQVCRFDDRPFPGDVTLATLGMSHEVLQLPSGRNVRVELLLCVHRAELCDRHVRALVHMAESAIRNGVAMVRGEVIDVGEAIVPGQPAHHLYCAYPVLFPEELWEYSGGEVAGPSTILVWVLPILPSEADYVAAEGWERFEAVLESRQVDLLGVSRASVV